MVCVTGVYSMEIIDILLVSQVSGLFKSLTLGFFFFKDLSLFKAPVPGINALIVSDILLLHPFLLKSNSSNSNTPLLQF